MDAHAVPHDIIDADEEQRLAVAIGAELRGIRNKRRISQEDLAASSGVSKRQIVRIEAGEGGEAGAGPRLGQIYRLCRALGVLPSTVIEAAEDEIDIR
ncbi:helix-turn-helix domain-containing protein [Nocardia nova]|nr:helix-turn-helix transcriptional regulator [Nocardia nova]